MRQNQRSFYLPLYTQIGYLSTVGISLLNKGQKL
jgi:hypothetical protein